jgi:hypothetical protein
MLSEDLMFHLVSIGSVIADLWVGILALITWKSFRMKGFLFLAIACLLYLIGSTYSYLSGLWGLGFMDWPLPYDSSRQVYFLIQWISLASQIGFIFSIVLIVRDIKFLFTPKE